MFDRVSGMIPSGAEAHEGRGFEALVTVAALHRARSSPWRSSSTRARPSSAHLWVSVTWLDDIQVGERLWTSATDNGNGGVTTANSTIAAAELVSILGEPLSVAFGS